MLYLYIFICKNIKICGVNLDKMFIDIKYNFKKVFYDFITIIYKNKTIEFHYMKKLYFFCINLRI